MLGSAYSCDVTVWKPIAGPPARISSFTPVSTPPCATSSPVTDFLPVSNFGFGPSSWYWPPCSDSGFQSDCRTTVLGQPAAFRSYWAGTAPPADAPGAGLAVSSSPPQAAATRASATAAAVAATILVG